MRRYYCTNVSNGPYGVLVGKIVLGTEITFVVDGNRLFGKFGWIGRKKITNERVMLSIFKDGWTITKLYSLYSMR